jgi:subtilisin family serine protease
MRRHIVLALTAGLVLALLPGAVGQARPASTPDPNVIPGAYIVVLHEAAGDPDGVAADHQRDHGARVTHVYRHALRGYAASMSDRSAARIARDSRVAWVEQDQLVYALAQSMPTGVDRVAAPTTNATAVAHLGIDGVDNKRVDVDVAIIDTGIDHNHPDLNVVSGTDCTGGGPFSSNCTDGLAGDGNGHGTHVAGTVGALDNGIGVVGVAPGARLHAVKVLRNDGSGYMSWIAAGIDWVTARAPGVAKPPGGNNIEVANMSLGCACTSAALDTALNKSVNAGVTHVVAAGNSNLDLKDNVYSPARHPKVITVSALSDGDGKSGGAKAPTCRSGEGDDIAATFTNYDSSGTYVDITAPGVCINSTWPSNSYKSISGTSMAAPHVAGGAALLASLGKYAGKPTDIAGTLKAAGNLGWTDTKNDGHHERLLDVSKADTFAPQFVGETTPASVPVAPSVLGATAVSSSQIDLKWTDNSDNEDGFRIEQADGTSWLFVASVGAGVQAYSHVGLAASTTYTYRVIAYNSAGYSPPSNEASATTWSLDSGGALTASFTYSCDKNICTFDASASGATAYSWDFGDDGEGSGVRPTHTYTAAGSWNVVLTAFKDADSKTATQTVSCTTRGRNIQCR